MCSRVAFPALDGELVVAGAAGLLGALATGLPGWPARVVGGDVSADIDADAAAADADAVERANAIIGLLVDGVLARRPQMVCLHAAGVQVGRGAVLLTGPTAAGKSSLALHLARRGHRCLGDDQVLIDLARPPHAVALGLAVKARLPLPPHDALERFVADRIAASDADEAFLHLHDTESAGFGTRVPLRAIVVLDRLRSGGSGETTLAPVSAGGAVARLLEQTTAPGRSPEALIAMLSQLVATTPVATLRYVDSDCGAARIVAAYGKEA